MSEIQTEISPEEKELRERLAAEAGLNGNGNGHHKANGSASSAETEQPAAEKTAPENSGEKKFSMFDDLAQETEQDKARAQGNGPGSGTGPNNQDKAGPQNPFDNFGPEHDVKEEDLRNEENISLQEANARVALYITTLDFAISLICCSIRGDYSIAAQLKYRIHTWRKKAIQVPWVRYVMIPKKRSHPGFALAGAIFVGTLPVFGMAFMDNMHDEKVKEDPKYADKHKDKSQDRKQYEKENSEHYRKATGAKKSEDPEEGEYVEFVEIHDEDDNDHNNQDNGNGDGEKNTRRGRHRETCPKHYDKNSKEPCNCK